MLEGEYQAISGSCTYAMIPTSHEIHIWLVTQGDHCVLSNVLNPLVKIEQCMYTLFIKNSDLIHTHCLVGSYMQHANFALNLDGYIFAVSPLATEHICCLEETQLEIVPPQHI